MMQQISGSKQCRKCGEVKAETEYYRRGPGKGMKYFCKVCENEGSRQRYRANLDQNIKLSAQRHLKSKFGITEDDVARMHAEQGGVCAICGKEELETMGCRLSVDHCHGTGRVRGLLCRKCNSGIGFFNDDPIMLAKAIDYLS